MASSCLEAWIGNRITDREMVDHLSLAGCQVEITVHVLIEEGANARRSIVRALPQRDIGVGR